LRQRSCVISCSNFRLIIFNDVWLPVLVVLIGSENLCSAIPNRSLFLPTLSRLVLRIEVTRARGGRINYRQHVNTRRRRDRRLSRAKSSCIIFRHSIRTRVYTRGRALGRGRGCAFAFAGVCTIHPSAWAENAR